MNVEINILPPQSALLPNKAAAFEITVSAIGVRQFISLPFDNFHRLFGYVSTEVESDLLVFCSAIYLTDQLISRSLFADNWTRKINVQLPVKEPDLWKALAAQFTATLGILTGDQWGFIFTERKQKIYHGDNRRLKKRRVYPARTACLFSGGLDSMTGAIDFLETNSEPLILVGHRDLGASAGVQQHFLWQEVDKNYPYRTNLIQERISRLKVIKGGQGLNGIVRNPAKLETTFRSRSIVFLGLGVYIANQLKTGSKRRLLIPENGLIAFNPPLTAARLGSCSTKTVFPTFISGFQNILHQLDIDVEVQNPLSSKTKGQVIAQSANPKLINDLVQHTVSCAHPTRRTGWIRKQGILHCGYCVPCLYRRASLHKIGLDDGKQYGIDVLAGEAAMSEDTLDDFRAMLSWVYNARVGKRNAKRIVQSMLLQPHNKEVGIRLIEQGISEMTQFIMDKAVPNIQEWAGLS